MKKWFLFTLIIIPFVLASGCLQKKSSANEKIYKDWNKNVVGQFSFYSPKDWVFKQRDFGPGKVYGVNPPLNMDLEYFFSFEVVEMPSEGHTFSEFHRYAIDIYNKRSGGKADLISEKELNFNNLEADLIQWNMPLDSTQIDNYFSMYIINGGSKYYMININRDSPARKFKIDGILNLILKSVEISI